MFQIQVVLTIEGHKKCDGRTKKIMSVSHHVDGQWDTEFHEKRLPMAQKETERDIICDTEISTRPLFFLSVNFSNPTQTYYPINNAV
jgi:hypothetical protein